MGLLDALFNSGGYGGQNGGLLDLIRSTQAQQDQYQPSQGFQPPPQFGSGRDFNSAQFNPATYAPNQAQPIAVGGYQMPRIGGADQFTPPQQAALPPNAEPTQGQLPQQAPQSDAMQLPPALAGTSLLGRIGNPDGLIARLTGNDSRSISQQNASAQYNAIRQALIQNGDTPQVASSKAMVAALNPEAAKTILPELFTSKTELKMVKDAAGGEHPFSWNSREQTLKPVGANGEGSGDVSSGFGMYAPGVSQIDSSKSGEDYLNQYSPEIKAAVKAYMNGDVAVTGNPRQTGINTLAKTVAQKYGADIGVPVSDALYAEKRKYRTELGSNSAATAGGSAKAFNQGIDHLSSMATTLEKLDNSNGMGIPAIAGITNSIRQGVSNQQSAIADEAKSLAQTVAGEVGKLFSGSAGGGVHEREATRERFDSVKSKPQLAAALQATIETMQGGLRALEMRRDAVLGPNSGVDLVDNTTREKIAQIQSSIDRLKGNASPSAGGLPSGWSVKVR